MYDGAHSHFQVNKSTVHIFCIVDLVENAAEGVEISTFELDFSATRLRTSWGHELFDGGPIVIPEVLGVVGELLMILRN